MGNTNAMKHGLYMSVMRPDEVEDLERLTSISLLHELVLVRTVLLRLANYLKNEDLALEDLLAIVPAMVGGVRTVAFLMKNIDTNLFDWDEVLDVLNDEWEIDV